MLSSSPAPRRIPWLLVTLALVGCGASDTDRQVLSADTSVYAVLEVVPREGVGLEKDRVGPTRVIAVDLVPAAGTRVRGYDEDFAVECGAYVWTCGQLASKGGALLLRTVHTTPLEAGSLQDWPVGETRELKGWRLDFLALDGTPLMRLIPPEGEKQVRAEVRLVKKCPARVSRVRYSALEGTGSGVIAVPRKVKRTWVEVEARGCFSPEDVQPVLPTPQEEQQAQAAVDAAEAYRLKSIQETLDRKARALAYRDERFAAFEAKAAQLALQPPLSTLRPEELSAAERPLHPQTAALMQAAGIQSVELEEHCGTRRTASKRQTRGSCKSWTALLAVTWRDGEVQRVQHGANRVRGEHFRRAALDAGGVLRVAAADPPALAQARKLLDKVVNNGQASASPEQVEAARAAAVAEQVRETVLFAVRELKPRSDKDPRRLPLPENWSLRAVP